MRNNSGSNNLSQRDSKKWMIKGLATEKFRQTTDWLLFGGV
jgi:hypothetical protein